MPGKMNCLSCAESKDGVEKRPIRIGLETADKTEVLEGLCRKENRRIALMKKKKVLAADRSKNLFARQDRTGKT